jgi:hypothetical protein
MQGLKTRRGHDLKQDDRQTQAATAPSLGFASFNESSLVIGSDWRAERGLVHNSLSVHNFQQRLIHVQQS